VIKHRRFFLTLTAIVSLLSNTYAQQQTKDTLQFRGDEVTVSASSFRIDSMQASVVRLKLPTYQQTSLRNTQLDELLRFIPGVMSSDRQNLSLGERFTIRGSGWQSAFGVRGVQVFYEDLPLTTLDGQTMLELVDPQRIASVSVMRGASSAYYGNSSGGAIQFGSDFSTREQHVIRLGAFQTASLGVQIAQSSSKNQAQYLTISVTGQEGYRNHSGAVLYRLGLHGKKMIGNQVFSWQSYTVAAPQMDNPGALTQTQLDSNPRQANAFNLSQDAGKSMVHQAFQLMMEDPERWSVRLFSHIRDLDNPLAFGWVNVLRVYSGLKWDYRFQRKNQSFVFFGDAALQHDSRKNAANNGGFRGALTVNQQEVIQNAALGTSWRSRFADNWSSEITARFDATEYRLQDAFFEDGDQAGKRLFLMPALSGGITRNLSFAQLFATVRSSYDLPTTTELVNRVDGLPGFNPSIQPEENQQIEVGIKSDLWGVSMYHSWLNSLKIGKESVVQPGRTVYENAGSGRVWGAEFYGRWQWHPNHTVIGQISSLFSSMNDKQSLFKIPGVPTVFGLISSQSSWNSWVWVMEGQGQTKQWVNQLNDMTARPWLVFHAQLGYEMGDFSWFARMHNVFNLRYTGSVSVNANGGRFFEPALPRSIWLGIVIK
jgi:iron complex outermembrane receptor protein